MTTLAEVFSNVLRAAEEEHERHRKADEEIASRPQSDLSGYTRTERRIAELLTENTGRHFLDSGGAYGRNWERNVGRDFAAEPATRITEVGVYRDDEATILVCHNLFHWLRDRVELDDDAAALQADLEAFAEEYEDDHWLSIVDRWIEERGMTSEGTVNTYNGEDLLSQVLQYHLFHIDNGSFVALQIHGGCDVRGGYTDPQVFRCDGDGLWDNANAALTCECCGAEWSTDDGYNWYVNWAGKIPDTCPAGQGKLLDVERSYPTQLDLRKYAAVMVEDNDDAVEPPTPERGVLYLQRPDVVVCPYCLMGRLQPV
jgi:hypothetical protein